VVRWDTPNYNPPKDRKGWRNAILAVFILVVAVGAIIAVYPYLSTSSTIKPPPVNRLVCNVGTDTNCFNSEINASQFKSWNLQWGLGDGSVYNNSAASPTIRPFYLQTNSTIGTLAFQFGTTGATSMNVSLIRIFDMNMSSTCNLSLNNCSTYTCASQFTNCLVTSTATVYFTSSIPLRQGDIYQVLFKSSGNLAIWQIRFHA
jgi:hypothetical protein